MVMMTCVLPSNEPDSVHTTSAVRVCQPDLALMSSVTSGIQLACLPRPHHKPHVASAGACRSCPQAHRQGAFCSCHCFHSAVAPPQRSTAAMFRAVVLLGLVLACVSGACAQRTEMRGWLTGQSCAAFRVQLHEEGVGFQVVPSRAKASYRLADFIVPECRTV